MRTHLGPARTGDPRVTPVTHVIGAGLAGLAAALALVRAGRRVVLHEASAMAGGRCRSYYDPILKTRIDNGNHLVLSGNRATLAYLAAIGASDRLSGPADAQFPFMDLQSGERWTLRLSASRIPWWMLDARKRVLGTRTRDYLSLVKLMLARPAAPAARVASVADVTGGGVLYERLTRPLFLAALNTDPAEAPAALAAAVMRETLAAGGRACRPLFAREGLSHALIDPALDTLRAGGAALQFGSRLIELEFQSDSNGAAAATALRFRSEAGTPQQLALGPADSVVMAIPASAAGNLLPGLQTPNVFRAIVNAHFLVTPPPGCPPILGLVNATAEWIFAFENRLSVTISGADRLLDVDRETLARQLWREVAIATGARHGGHADASIDALPPWQIVRERRATYAALPEQEARRPGTRTRWSNVFLAGDWTATGLPATIEGAIRSGDAAAACVLHAGHRRNVH
ncbi:MAG: hydroxysqualene dehydroxylase HpnE [Janthinobacterium lividum]